MRRSRKTCVFRTARSVRAVLKERPLLASSPSSRWRRWRSPRQREVRPQERSPSEFAPRPQRHPPLLPSNRRGQPGLELLSSEFRGRRLIGSPNFEARFAGVPIARVVREEGEGWLGGTQSLRERYAPHIWLSQAICRDLVPRKAEDCLRGTQHSRSDPPPPRARLRTQRWSRSRVRFQAWLFQSFCFAAFSASVTYP